MNLENASPPAHQSAPVLLMADDSDDDILLTRIALEQSRVPHSFHSVLSGEHAIQYLEGAGPFTDRARYPFPDLLILDIHMPITDGIEVLRHIRAHPVLRRLPVVMFSSSMRDQDIQTAYQAGGNAFILKPSAFPDLVTELKEFAQYWCLWNRPPAPVPLFQPHQNSLTGRNVNKL